MRSRIGLALKYMYMVDILCWALYLHCFGAHRIDNIFLDLKKYSCTQHYFSCRKYCISMVDGSAKQSRQDSFSGSQAGFQFHYSGGFDLLRYMLYLAVNLGSVDKIFLAINPANDEAVGHLRNKIYFTQLFVLSYDAPPNLSRRGHSQYHNARL